MAVTNCRYFNGYKPCAKSTNCDAKCPHLSEADERILIVSLEALGAVLRSTVLLPAIKRKYPNSHITWVTQRPAQDLLMHNPLIDRLLTTERDDLLALRALEFDIAYVVDKSLKAAGVLRSAKAQQVFGFVADRNGAIVPANSEAFELWRIGLSDQKKFFENEKPETRLLVEAMALGPDMRDAYVLAMSNQERKISLERRRSWSVYGQPLVGLNTGASGTLPHKKWPVEFQNRLIKELERNLGVQVVLLGGKEDTIRNQQIAAGTRAILSPTESGIRDGICSLAATDLVISGDSLGMHMAIALKKWVIAWFGPTCAQEIDLYDRGEKLIAPVGCGPCWKRTCSNTPLCSEVMPVDEVVMAVRRGLAQRVDYGSLSPYGANYESELGHTDSVSRRSSAQPAAVKEP